MNHVSSSSSSYRPRSNSCPGRVFTTLDAEDLIRRMSNFRVGDVSLDTPRSSSSPRTYSFTPQAQLLTDDPPFSQPSLYPSSSQSSSAKVFEPPKKRRRIDTGVSE